MNVNMGIDKVSEGKRRIIVTGAKGQLGVDMVNFLRGLDYQVYGLSRQELDIVDNKKVLDLFGEIKPDIVIHSAAYTQVDQAESEQDNAYRVNAYGTRNIAVASESIGAKLVYVSTDYVFNGSGTEPYHEFMLTDPIGIYGKSKLAGEEFVRQFHSKFFIIRTSWVYGKHGNNFVKTMLNLAKEREKLTVVADQIGCPTYTIDLAECIAQLAETSNYGTYHVSNSGHCSWYEFAKAIFEDAGISVEVIPVTTEEFPRPAKRPNYSVFNHMALRLNGFPEMRHWRKGLKEFLKEINN